MGAEPDPGSAASACARGQAKDNLADLINVALEELVRARCELPGYTTLDALAATIRTEVNSAFYQAVAGRIGPVARLRLGRLLLVDPVTRRSEFDRWLEGVPPGKITHFASEARITDVADLRKIGDANKWPRSTRLVCAYGL